MNRLLTQPSGRVRSLRHDPAEQPFIVIWEVTRACELVCRHCRADAMHHRHPAELTTAEGKRLLDDLARFGPPRPLVVLTGGDPFERDDLEELVAHGTGRGLHVSLSPSVTPRLTRSTLARLRDAGAKAVSLSLDGAEASSHDGFRGVDGVFAATADAARMIRDLGLRLQINTTVTRGNVAELPAILRRTVGFDASLWSVFFLVPTGRGAQLEALDDGGTEDVLHWLYDVSRLVAIKTTGAPQFRRIVIQRDGHDVPAVGAGPLYARLRAGSRDLLDATRTAPRRAARPPLEVNAGKGFVFVDHLGAVYPSGFLPVPVGSIRHTPITELYRHAPLLHALRDPDAFHGRCGACGFRQVCGGSRSRAFATSGDPLGEDPACSYDPSSVGPIRPWSPPDPPAADGPAGARA